MGRTKLISATLLAAVLATVAWAVDVPGDEAGNRKLLALWKTDPDHVARLKQNLKAFRSLPSDQQEQLRELERGLQQLHPSKQPRLRTVMENYAGWLSRLPEPDRQKVNDAAADPDRLRVVQEILERQWQESLPKPDQDKLAKASPDERAKLLEKLRADESERHKLRQHARLMIEEAADFGPTPFAQPQFRERIMVYVEDSLRPLLIRTEEDRLNRALEQQMNRRFPVILELSEGRNPLPFPGPAPFGSNKAIRSWQDLPVSVTEKFPDAVPERIRNAEGKWPQFPLAVIAEAKERNVTLNWSLLGPTKQSELPLSVQKFVKDDLSSKLSESEKRQLIDAETKWPDYPRKVKELADKHRLPIPGIALPGTREQWLATFQRPRLGKLGNP